MVREPVLKTELLVHCVRELSKVRTFDDIASVIRQHARKLVSADGVTFVIKDRNHCHYADEDAISPLWKGKRFPIANCISGWAMINKQQVVLPDIYVDDRIPADLYRPTFVKSLVMTPVRLDDPIAAIGIYWANNHHPEPTELALLQTLADTASVAIDNVTLYRELENRVEERTKQLEERNRDLQAFAATVSHDLRTPLIAMNQLTELALVRNFDSHRYKAVLENIGKESKRLRRSTVKSVSPLCSGIRREDC